VKLVIAQNFTCWISPPNAINGLLASEIGQCKYLSYLELYENSLDGTIPIKIGHHIELAMMSFSSSSLTGSIPNEIGKCSKLTYLDLNDNTRKGTILEPFLTIILQKLLHITI
jgi:hypothetical protein